MAYDGTLRFDTSIDSSGFREDSNKLSDLVKGLGIFELFKKGFELIGSSIDAAVSRYDTLNRFPQIMEKMGYSAEESAAATQKLSDGIQGLPTTLDGIVGSTKQLVIATGGLDKGVNSALALNNAFLASGATSEEASRGLTQYVQMLSSGKVDMQSWRTLNETMTYALQKTAESFGFAGASAKQDLYAALRDGKITFTQFNDRIIELNDGVGGFAEVAKTSTGGIGTAWTNMKTAIVRGTTGIIESIDNGLSETRFVSIENMIASMKDGILISLGFVAEAFGFVAENADTLTPLLVAIGVAVVAWKIAGVLTGVIGGFQAAALQVGLYSLSVGGAITADALQTAGLTAKEIIVGVLTGKIGLVTAAQYVWNAAMNANPIGLIIAAIVILIGLAIALGHAFNKDTEDQKALKQSTDALTEANRGLTQSIEENTAAYAEKEKGIVENAKVSEKLADEVFALMAVENRSAEEKARLAALVSQLNASMPELNLLYDEEADALNKTSSEVYNLIDAKKESARNQAAQERAVEIAKDQMRAEEQLAEVSALRAEIEQRKADGLDQNWRKQFKLQGQLDELIEQEAELTNQIQVQEMALTKVTDTMVESSRREAEAMEQVAAATNETATAYDAHAEAVRASLRAQEIRSDQMDAVKNYAELWVWSTDEVIEAASKLEGGLEELAVQQSKLYTDTGRDVGMLSEAYGQSTGDIQKWLDDTGKSLDDYVKWAEKNLSKDGLTVEQLATKWGVSADSIRRDIRMNEQSVAEWEAAQQDALDTVREYATQAGKSYEEIAAEAEKAGMSVEDYVDHQSEALTSSGADIERVAKRWGVTVEDIQDHMDAYRVSLDQANEDMAAMRTKSGLSLDALASLLGKTAAEVRADAAVMGQSWQEYGDAQEQALEEAEKQFAEYAKTYSLTTEEVKAGIAAMGGDTEAWVEKTEQSLRAAEVAEQAYVDQIKAGNVEISASYAENLEARRINGEELNTIEQAYLDQWNTVNQAAADAYKAQQQEIVDATKAKANAIKTADQQSAKDILTIQRQNNEVTAQYVENYNTIWGQIPESQREHLAELGIDNARFLSDIVKKWDSGGKEQWEQYVAGIEQGKETAAEKAGGAAQDVGDAFIAGTEAKEPEVKKAGTEFADATGAGMKESTAPSEASQQIANAVIRDLTNADYSGITGGIAAAIQAGTGNVTAAASGMSQSVQEVIRGLTTQTQTLVLQLVSTSIVSTIISRSASVKASVTAMANGVTAELETMKTQAGNLTTQMMTTSINSAITGNTSTVKSSVTTLSNGILAILGTTKTDAEKTAGQMMTGVNSAITGNTSTVKSSATKAAAGVTDALSTMKQDGTTSATQMMSGIKSAISDGTPSAKTAASTTAKGITQNLDAMVSGGKDAANNMMAGMLAAMVKKAPELYAKAKEIADNIAKTIRKALDINSPSRVMVKIFEYVMMGAYQGMENLEGKLYHLAEDISGGISDRLALSPDALSSSVERLKALVESNPFTSGYPTLAGAGAGGLGGITYVTSLKQNITTPKPLSASEMTREGQDMLRRSKWQLP